MELFITIIKWPLIIASILGVGWILWWQNVSDAPSANDKMNDDWIKSWMDFGVKESNATVVIIVVLILFSLVIYSQS